MGKLRILARECDPFRNRQEAGRLLGLQLLEFRGKGAVILGVPRGGIIIARELAELLQADLDIVLSRKLRAPMQPELAAGSLSESGNVFYNDTVLYSLGINRDALEEEREIQAAEILRRKKTIRAILPKIEIKNRIVIVTDDGIATGATIEAAVWSVRQENPAYLVVAVPVGPYEAVQYLATGADELVCLCTPSDFMAVGQFYREFDQVSDEQVLDILRLEKQKKTAAPH